MTSMVVFLSFSEMEKVKNGRERVSGAKEAGGEENSKKQKKKECWSWVVLVSMAGKNEMDGMGWDGIGWDGARQKKVLGQLI